MPAWLSEGGVSPRRELASLQTQREGARPLPGTASENDAGEAPAEPGLVEQPRLDGSLALPAVVDLEARESG